MKSKLVSVSLIRLLAMGGQRSWSPFLPYSPTHWRGTKTFAEKKRGKSLVP